MLHKRIISTKGHGERENLFGDTFRSLASCRRKCVLASAYFDGLQELDRLLHVSFQVDSHHAAKAFELSLEELVLRMTLQAWVDDPLDPGVVDQSCSQSHGVLGMLLHADRQGLDSSVHKIAIERRWYHSNVLCQKET